jgi:hypothetical protein
MAKIVYASFTVLEPATGLAVPLQTMQLCMNGHRLQCRSTAASLLVGGSTTKWNFSCYLNFCYFSFIVFFIVVSEGYY